LWIPSIRSHCEAKASRRRRKAEVALFVNNNSGGARLTDSGHARNDVVRITNRRAAPLVFSDFQGVEGGNEFGLIGCTGEVVLLG
jgi:hypothetical protein